MVSQIYVRKMLPNPNAVKLYLLVPTSSQFGPDHPLPAHILQYLLALYLCPLTQHAHCTGETQPILGLINLQLTHQLIKGVQSWERNYCTETLFANHLPIGDFTGGLLSDLPMEREGRGLMIALQTGRLCLGKLSKLKACVGLLQLTSVLVADPQYNQDMLFYPLKQKFPNTTFNIMHFHKYIQRNDWPLLSDCVLLSFCYDCC